MLRVRDAVLRTWPSEQAAVRNIAEARAHVLAETEAMIPPGFQTVPTRSGWMVQVTSRALQSGPPAWTVEGEGVTVEVTGDRALMAWAGDLPDRDVVAGLQTADGTALVRMTIHAAARTMEIEGSGAVVAMAPQFAVLYPSPGSSGGLAWQNLATSRTGQVLKIWQDEQEIGVLCFAPEGKVCPQGAIEVGWVHGKSGWALMRTLDVVEQAPSGWILRRE